MDMMTIVFLAANASKFLRGAKPNNQMISFIKGKTLYNARCLHRARRCASVPDERLASA